MFLKKSCALLLALLLLVPALAAAEEIPTYHPGDTVELTFTVTDNPNHVVGTRLLLIYNHDVFSLIPSSSVQNDAPIVSLNLNGIPVGETVTVSFRVAQDAAGGAYDFSIQVVQAADIDENEVDGFAFSTCQVMIAADDQRDFSLDSEAELRQQLEEVQRQLDELLKALEEEKGYTAADSADSSQAAPETDFTYEISGGKATITEYVGSGGDVVIPAALGGYPVDKIGDSAFNGCGSLTKVTIPAGVTSIEKAAFYQCGSLTKVTIPGSVTSIGRAAFYQCKALQSIMIPESVTFIGKYAFYSCVSLVSVTIPSSVTSIESNAFSECSGLQSVAIPSSVTSIGPYAFDGCSGLTSVTIPDSVSSIERYAFARCSKLSDVSIPVSVTSIEDHVFAECSGLRSVSIPYGVTYIGRNAFDSCIALGSVFIPSSVYAIDLNAFSKCVGLTLVTLPSSVTYIGYSAFEYCGENVVFHVAKGSTAQQYCEHYQLNYEAQ